VNVEAFSVAQPSCLRPFFSRLIARLRAGHMVPKDQPQVALEMLKQFVNHEPF
jgi:hypothetical protein